MAGASLIRGDALFLQLSLPIISVSVDLGHLSVSARLLLAHVAPRLFQVVHDLLGRPHLVDQLQDLALLLREEDEGA